MSARCDKNQPCLERNKIVVIDTCVLTHVTSSILSLLNNGIFSPTDYLEGFYTFFEDYLMKMKLCPSNRILITSKKVYEDEIDPIRSNSALFKCKGFDLLGEIDSNAYQRIRRILLDNISYGRYNVPSDEISQMRRYLRDSNQIYNRSSDNDLSLLVLCIKLGQKLGGILLTDDINLIRCSDAIKENREILINSSRLDTTRMISTTSLLYMSEIYSCCIFGSAQFYSLYDIFFDYSKQIENNSPNSYSLYNQQLNEIALRVMSDVNKSYSGESLGR